MYKKVHFAASLRWPYDWFPLALLHTPLQINGVVHGKEQEKHLESRNRHVHVLQGWTDWLVK